MAGLKISFLLYPSVLLELTYRAYEIRCSSENFQTSLFCYRMALASNNTVSFPIAHKIFPWNEHDCTSAPSQSYKAIVVSHTANDENNDRIVWLCSLLYVCRMEMLLMVGSWMRTVQYLYCEPPFRHTVAAAVGKKAGKICEAKIYFIFEVIGSQEYPAYIISILWYSRLLFCSTH